MKNNIIDRLPNNSMTEIKAVSIQSLLYNDLEKIIRSMFGDNVSSDDHNDSTQEKRFNELNHKIIDGYDYVIRNNRDKEKILANSNFVRRYIAECKMLKISRFLVESTIYVILKDADNVDDSVSITDLTPEFINTNNK